MDWIAQLTHPDKVLLLFGLFFNIGLTVVFYRDRRNDFAGINSSINDSFKMLPFTVNVAFDKRAVIVTLIFFWGSYACLAGTKLYAIASGIYHGLGT